LLFAILTAVSAAGALGLLLGLFDRFSPDGSVERSALGAVVTYWTLASIALWLAFRAARHWRELLLLVASLGVAGVIGEVAVRRFFTHRAMMRLTSIASERYHHVYPAARTMSGGTYDELAVVVTTNEDGLRSTYSRDEYVGHRRRIAFIGDSFTFGFGVPHDHTFSHVVEQSLRERLHDDVAVLNAGIVSYSPFLAGHLFDGIVRDYRPELVFYILDPSDIGDDVKYTNEALRTDGETRFPLLGSRAAYHGGLYEIGRPVLDPLRAYVAYPFAILRDDHYRFRVVIDGVTETSRFFIYRYPLEKTRTYFERTLAHIDALAEHCRRAGARFVLVVSPRYNHWNPAECPKDWETKAGYFSLEDPYQFEYFRFFEQARDSTEYDVLHLLPYFQATEEFPLVFENDPHWNERGHRFVAEILTQYIVDHQLLGSAGEAPK
jgi:hypothetical protein